MRQRTGSTVPSRLALAAAILGALSIPSASGERSELCDLLRLQAQFERDDLELAVDLAASEARAAQEISDLLDGLWKSDAVERLVYLTGIYERDAAGLNEQLQRQLLKRQTALVDQYQLLCNGGSGEELRRTYLRYREANCEALTTRVARAEVDLAYRTELLESVNDLRENGVATRQEVIISERNVVMARTDLDQAGKRVRACRKEIQTLREKSPG